MMAALLLAPVLSSCAPDANAEIISPNLGSIEVAKLEGGQIAPVVEEAAPTLADLTDEEIYAGLPAEIADAIPNADLANAETIALTRGCTGCHALDPQQQMTGPTWYNMGNIAVEHALAAGSPGPAEYLYTSIHAPNEYVVPDYPANIMPQNYDEQLTAQEFADLVAYLLAQQQGS
jgi:mono/diheme cytochrome c family protein